MRSLSPSHGADVTDPATLSGLPSITEAGVQHRCNAATQVGGQDRVAVMVVGSARGSDTSSLGLVKHDFADLHAVEDRLLAFQERYEQLATPFEWKFTRR